MAIESLVANYNSVFSKQLSSSQMQAKYINTVLGFSFHGMMIAKDQAVGNCSIIPYQYQYFDKIVQFGLVVDVFIVEEYRDDPLSLKKMYDGLKGLMRQNNISAIIAVPNELVYKYWKKIVRWKDIGDISYYAFPINLDVLRGRKNSVLWFLGRIIGAGVMIAGDVTKYSERISVNNNIQMLINDVSVFDKHRYILNHITIDEDGYSCRYKTYTEDGVKVTYLIDHYEIGINRTVRSLLWAVNWIRKNEKTDLILRIATHAKSIFKLLKVPESKVPKQLSLCGEILDDKVIDQESFLTISNWDFGLLNYDVR